MHPQFIVERKLFGKENQSTFYNFNRTELEVKIRVWRANKFDKLEVKAQAENTKNILPGVLESRETVRESKA